MANMGVIRALGVGPFDTDGGVRLRHHLTAAMMRAYNWPQARFVRPLDMKGAKPVFVVGCGHSGTSLLATVLGRSEELMLVGYESGAFFPKKGLFTAKEAVRAWVNISLQTSHKGFVEKTPKHIHCLNRIRKVVPGARFVAITRDGRDVMASFMGRGLSPEFAVRRWCEDNQAFLGARNAQDVIPTCYEAIVSRPEEEVARICRALAIPFSPEMLSGTDSGYGWISEKTMGIRAEQTSRAIYDGRGKWRDSLSESDLSIFWREARQLMEALEYPADMPDW